MTNWNWRFGSIERAMAGHVRGDGRALYFVGAPFEARTLQSGTVSGGRCPVLTS